MTIETATRLSDYLHSIKTQENKEVQRCTIRNEEDQRRFGFWAVRIIVYNGDEVEEIAEYYEASQRTLKAMREEVRTDFTRYYRNGGHLFYME